MMKPTTILILAALLAPMSQAQQQPQPQTQQAKVDPCITTTPPPAPPNGIKLHFPKRLSDALAKPLNGVEQNTGIHIDPNQVAKDATTPKPCPVATPIAQPKPQILPATPTPQTGIPNAKPEFVCPPKATLIPGQPYCIFSDRKVVDAIPLPSGILSDSPKPVPVSTAK
jgi:hypothetical protein